ncbi:sensor histidine kinase [Paenibacillus sp. BK033]|uniref:sensor histidine kinase n=1 Tax=Paenibacillus sp. BK033 TaxID=2512133 RepID=UPI0010522054|nr:sensor histidine kinase [Paenibacillus sp. BK033]
MMLTNLFNSRSSVQRKIVLSFLCFILFPLSLFSYASLSISKQTIRERAISGSLARLGLIADKLNIMASDLSSISTLYFSNSSLTDLLKTPSGIGGYEESTKRSFFVKTMINYKYAYTWLDYNTSIFGINGFELHTLYEGKKIGIHSVESEPWYNDVLAANGNIVWVTNPSSKLKSTVDDDYYVSAIRELKDFESGEMLGLVFISVGESFLYDQYRDRLQRDEQALLVDQDGIILSAPDKNQIGRSFHDYVQGNTSLSADSGNFTARLSGQDMLMTYNSVGKTGWKIISYTPIQSLYADITKLERLTLVILILIVAVSIIVSYFIARRLSVPIQRLARSMKIVEMGDLSERSAIDRRDEIGELARKFNSMVARIERLRDRVRVEEEMKRKTEIRALQSQINTHFLYNTLASIRSMLMIDKPEKVDSVIVALVKLLKRTLSEEGEYIPVAEEVDNLSNYVKIQQARQADHLRVLFNIDEQIVHEKMLKFLLQPIVENAIFHGIEPKLEPGTILIRGYRSEDGAIIFQIQDDGVGFKNRAFGEKDADVTETVLGESSGKGLRNIRDRLLLHYGKDAGMRIISRRSGGMEVVLHLPAADRSEETP